MIGENARFLLVRLFLVGRPTGRRKHRNPRYMPWLVSFDSNQQWLFE